MAATGIISGAMQAKPDPNAPQSGQEASASAIGAATPAAAPLGSASQSSAIAQAPSTSDASAQSGTGGAQSYLNQLNAAASSPAPSPSPSPTPTPAPAPAPAPYTQPDVQPDASPAPAPSGIITSARQKVQSSPVATFSSIPSSSPAPGVSPAPAPTPTPTPTTPAPISPLLTQPADYSKPESQAEIDAYNQLALQAGRTGDYSQLDSIGANDLRNVFGATFAPGDKANPAFIGAQMSGKSTDGIPQWLTPQQVSAGIYSLGADQVPLVQSKALSNPAQASSTQAAQSVDSSAGIAVPNGSTGGSRAATAADINADFASDFGRPADTAGLQFYQQALAANPTMTADQLNALILGGAQSQDQLAAASLHGGGSLAGNWTNPLLNTADVRSATTNPDGQDVWDAAANAWTVPAGAKLTGTANPNGAPTMASTYTPAMLGRPTQVDVNAPQTVAGQLANLENPNSPLIQAARTQALQQANASGLLNSTMAITAGDAAAYNAALPVAQQDATTYNNDAVTNAAAANQFAVDNQNAINAAGQFNAGAQNTLTGEKMTQAMSGAATAQQAGTVYANWLNQIQQSTMDANAKNTAEVQAYNTYLQQMQSLAAQGIPDVSGLLQFTGVDPNTGQPDYRDPVTGLYSSTSKAPGATPAPTPAPTPTPTPAASGPTNNPHQ